MHTVAISVIGAPSPAITGLVICPNKTAPAAAVREITVDALSIDCLLRDFSFVTRRTVAMPRENPARGSGGCSRPCGSGTHGLFLHIPRQFDSPRPLARRSRWLHLQRICSKTSPPPGGHKTGAGHPPRFERPHAQRHGGFSIALCTIITIVSIAIVPRRRKRCSRLGGGGDERDHA